MNNSRIIPTMRYNDAQAAIKWLCEVLGFEEKMVVPGEASSIAHAQLTMGNGMVMVSSARATEYDNQVKPPQDLGGICTQSVYIYVENLDEHYESTVASGAEISIPFYDEEHGRGYGVKDREGQLWNFGDYDPWA